MLDEVIQEIDRQHQNIRITQRGPVATFAKEPLDHLAATFRRWRREQRGG